jgi:hypothetical protein
VLSARRRFHDSVDGIGVLKMPGKEALPPDVDGDTQKIRKCWELFAELPTRNDRECEP